MVELVRNSKIFGALIAAFLWVFGPLIAHWDHHEDETPDEDVASVVLEKQRAAILPPMYYPTIGATITNAATGEVLNTPA
jgi:hypothetical protein